MGDSPHVQSFLGVFNQPITYESTVDPFINYLDSVGELIFNDKDPEFLNLVKSCDIHCRSINSHEFCVILIHFSI